MSSKNKNLKKARDKNLETLSSLQTKSLEIQERSREIIKDGFLKNQDTLELAEEQSLQALIEGRDGALGSIFTGLDQVKGELGDQYKAEQFFINSGLSEREATRRAGLRDTTQNINDYLSEQRQIILDSQARQRGDITQNYGSARAASEQGFDRTSNILDRSLFSGQQYLAGGQARAEDAISQNTAGALGSNLFGTTQAVNALSPYARAGAIANDMLVQGILDPSSIQQTAAARFREYNLDRRLQDELTATGLENSGAAISQYKIPAQLQLAAQNEAEHFNRLNALASRGMGAAGQEASLINTGTGRDVQLRTNQGQTLASLYSNTAAKQQAADAQNRLMAAGASSDLASQLINSYMSQGRDLSSITNASNKQLVDIVGRAGELSSSYGYQTQNALAGDSALATDQRLRATQSMYGNLANATTSTYNNAANINSLWGQNEAQALTNYANANLANQDMRTQGLTGVNTQEQNMAAAIANAQNAVQQNYYNNKNTTMDYLKPMFSGAAAVAGAMTGNPGMAQKGMTDANAGMSEL